MLSGSRIDSVKMNTKQRVGLSMGNLRKKKTNKMTRSTAINHAHRTSRPELQVQKHSIPFVSSLDTGVFSAEPLLRMPTSLSESL